jgi:Cu+-exporting ATPase
MDKDLVCGKIVSKESTAAKSNYKGKTYCFCTSGCKKAFDRNPDKYVKVEEEYHGMYDMYALRYL